MGSVWEAGKNEDRKQEERVCRGEQDIKGMPS